MIKKILNIIWDFLEVNQCPYCDSIDLSKGYYTRGWNNLCGQADGDNGYYCNNCRKVHFIRSLEEYKKALPSWCTAGNK